MTLDTHGNERTISKYKSSIKAKLNNHNVNSLSSVIVRSDVSVVLKRTVGDSD